jgi:hypothetical protein
MNLIEDRIRAAARAAADTVAPDSVPPLELPAARPQRFGRRRRGARSPDTAWSTWGPRLAPWAAAAAIIALVITLVNVGPAPTQGGPSGPTGPSLAGPPGIPAGPPVSSYIRSGQIPPFYVTLTPPDAAVHVTENGATLATIRPSRPGGTVVAVTAAADDRTFVLAEQSQDRKAVTFYEVRLGSSGRPGTPAPLEMSVRNGNTMTGLALSPDGTRLAIAIAAAGGRGYQQLGVYKVHGTSGTVWSGRGGTIGVPLAATSLSWSADQRTLAFNWSVGQTRSVRLLNLASNLGLLAASRTAVTLPNSANMGQTLYQCGYLIITPDGSKLVCASGTITTIAKNGVITYSTGFPEFSAATGRVTRIAGHWSQPQDGKGEPTVIDVLWSDASGQVLIGEIHSADRYWVGVIRGNTFTPLNVGQDPAVDFGTW